MKFIYKLISAAAAVLLLITCAGCKESYQEAIIYFELPARPTTLDPQTASSDSELLIVKNIYEGLFRKNASGAIVCGASESFTFENSTYTFKLRKDAVWNNGDPLTANDFVFGLRRAVSPETQAPFASRLFCIQNAENIYNSKAKPETLGVSAPDDYTVVIKLSKNDESFEETLASSVAMPCNQSFFTESAGKYGLTKEYTISNGSYRLAKWVKEETFGIRLYKNENYNGTLPAKNSAAYITCDDEETALEKLNKNSIDMAFIDSSLTEEAKESGLNIINYENICWVMTLNSQFSSDMRKSFAMLIGSEVFGNDLKPGYSAADSLYPAAVNPDATPAGMTFYNLSTAKELFTKEINKLENKKFPSDIRLYYYDNGIIKPIITDIVGHWQNNLGAFVNIEAVDSPDKLISQLKKQTYNMAVFPVRAESSDIEEYLESFGVSADGNNPDSVQTEVLKNNHIIPIAFQNTSIAYSKALNDVYTELGNGYIDFSFIVKTE